MGLQGLSIGHVLVVLLVVALVFGTGRLRSLGSDLGAAIKGFRSALDKDAPARDGRIGTTAPKDQD